MRLILLGGPGAGKGTQAAFLRDKLAIPQISTGDMLRAAVQADSAAGMAIKKTMDDGELVSDGIIIGLVKERISEPDCENGFLFDGFPRTMAQLDAMVNAKVDIDGVVEIDVDDEEIIRRIIGRRIHRPSGRVYHVEFNPPKVANVDDETGEALVQRDDDQESTVRHRLSVYHKQTVPLKQQFMEMAKSDKESGLKYIKVSGLGTVDAIRNLIFTALGIQSS